jgi:flavin reductase (DIM6/NTAB) family NADH-FMN oxidoreductase RutF
VNRDARTGGDGPDEALHLIPGPVAVVGAAADGVLGGLTAAWLTRVSHEPPLLAVSIGHERHTHGLMASGERFTVSVLREGQVEVGRHFGLQSQRDVDKWPAVDHVLLEGVPALARCAARFLCRRADRLPAGDHDIFVGEILEAEIVDGGPALSMRGEDWAP